ncbi:MAG: polysaccharide biosynthesis tyrosine autokinase [bacterium]
MNNERYHDGHDDKGSFGRDANEGSGQAHAFLPARTQPVPRDGSRRRAKGADANQSSALNLAFVLTVLRKWWKVGAPLGLLLAGAGVAVMWWQFEPVYKAQAWLRIENRRPYIAFPTKDGSRQFVNTQVALIRSPLVIEPALSKLDVSGITELAGRRDKVKWLGDKINVKSVGNSEFFVVSYESPNRQNAADVVNAVIDAFEVARGSADADRTQKIVELLDTEQRRRESKVSELRERVRQMTKEATGKDPYAAKPEAETAAENPLSGLHMQLADAEVKRTVAEVQAQALEQSIASSEFEIPDGVIQEAVDNHSEVQAVEEAIAARTKTLAEYEGTLVGGKEHPRYVELSEVLAEDKDRLERVRQQASQEIRSKMRGDWHNRREGELAELQSQVEDYRMMQQAFQKLCDENIESRQATSSISLDLEFARIELARAQEIRNRIADRIETLKTEQRAPDRIDLQKEATPPQVPVEVLPVKKLSLLSLALFALPFSLAVGWELLVRRVGDADRLEQDAQVPVVGEIARLPVRNGRNYGFSNRHALRGMGMFEESVDTLRTCLVMSERLENMKVVLVTSAVSGEGKTSVAVQLAVSLARASGKRTLLVDADMRAPDIHGLLDLPLEPGFCDVLAGDCSLKDAIQTEFSEKVHVLTAGEMHTSPHRLVGNGTLSPTFERFREEYGYVVVDSPPILAVGEALVLARQADASLICAMRDSSRVDQVRRAYDRLIGAGTRPCGVVLNGVPIDSYSRRYGTYGYERTR